MSETTSTSLFVYGSLISEQIQERIIGRVPDSSPATLTDYGCYFVLGATFPGIIRETGKRVDGLYLDGLTDEEILRLDNYEDDFYDRNAVVVSIANERISTQAYIVPRESASVLSKRAWSWTEFERKYLETYIERLG